MLPIILISDNSNFALDEIIKQEKIVKINISSVKSDEKAFGINQVREIKKTIFLKAIKGNKKALIIENFQTATLEAQNAMLKILEEPPNNTLIVLLSANLNLLPTVISRCRVITLKNEQKQSNNDIMTEFANLIEANLSYKFYFAQEKAKNKKELLDWIKDLSLKLRFAIERDHNQDNIVKLYSYLEKINETFLNLSQTNVSARFILENFLLKI